jgi:catechol 2,3-dioxygenase-like lactoylglutathione lyase family enzyme
MRVIGQTASLAMKADTGFASWIGSERMLMSLRVGTNDIAKARAFYNATFAALGGQPAVTPEAAPFAMYKFPEGPAFLVGPAVNGDPASHANGGTILLVAPDQTAIDAWHAAGIANGGSCEGPPGPREKAGGRYAAYLRDPDGNKLGSYVGDLFR